MCFLFPQVVYMIPVTLTVGVIAAFQIPAFTNQQNLAAIALLLVLFGSVNWEEFFFFLIWISLNLVFIGNVTAVNICFINAQSI